MNFVLSLPRKTSLYSPLWLSLKPFLEAKRRRDLLKMSLPVKYSSAAPRSAQGTTRKSIRRQGPEETFDAPCHFVPLSELLGIATMRSY